jgi:hypothetical protein
MRAGPILAALMLLLASQASAQDARGVGPAAQDDPGTTLDEIVVTGRRLDQAVQQYVETLSAPARMRGLARWDSEICVDVVNFQPAIRAEIAGRIRDVATALEVPVEAEGCEPNVVVLATDDGPALADAMVDRFMSRFFRFGSTRMNRGPAALEAFRRSDAPVRWWHVSLPVNAATGQPAVSLFQGRPTSMPCHSRSTATKDITAAGLGGSRTAAGCNAVTDRIIGLWVVVDVNASSGLSASQLADYLAFLTMAQVDPEADMSSFDTVMNLFDAPGAVDGITAWDETYLVSLYSGGNERIDASEQAARMVGSLSAPSDTPPAP